MWRGVVTNRGAVAVFLGPTGVTTSSGYQVDPDGSVSVELGPLDVGLYGIVASGTAVVHTLSVDT